MEKLYVSIDKLVSFAQAKLGLNSYDVDYVKNSVFALFDLSSYADTIVSYNGESLDDLLAELYQDWLHYDATLKEPITNSVDKSISTILRNLGIKNEER